MCHSVTSIQAGADRRSPFPEGRNQAGAHAGRTPRRRGRVDTHRDTHQVEIALPNGVPIASTTISNDATGYAELLAWIVDHAPGPRLAISIEGTRSYGVGLARAAAAAGLVVLEVRTTPPQGAPRQRQIRPDRRPPRRRPRSA
jgi:hypothetical protein